MFVGIDDVLRRLCTCRSVQQQ